MPDTFAKEILKIRERHDLTQDEMASVFPGEFSVKTLRNWEQGRSQPYQWMQPIILWWLEGRAFLKKWRRK